MTIKEAMAIALRELGHSDQEIKSRALWASGMVPRAATDSEVKPGCERQLIDYLKRLAKDPRLLSEALAASLRQQKNN